MPSLSSLESVFLHCGVHISSPCSRFDLSLSHQGAVLAYLDFLPPHDLVLWTDGSVPFPFGKGGSGILANCFFCGTEATLSFSAGPVCSSFSAQACAILHPLCWSRQRQQVCHFFSLLFFSYLTLVLSSPPCPLLVLSFYLKLFGRSGRNCLLFPFVLSGYNGVPGHSFLLRKNATDELVKRGALLALSAIPCILSTLCSRIHSCLFSDWRRTVSSKFFDTQAPSISTEKFLLPRYACCVVLSLLQRTQSSVKLLSL